MSWLSGIGNGFPLFLSTFVGLAFETVPFLLIGTLLSSLIHVLVPNEVLRGIFPRSRSLSLLTGLCVGTLVPICECGTVPLARGLYEKGLPLSTAAAFLLAAPLVNPVTVLSTAAAFHGTPRPVFLYRLLLGLAGAFVIAVLIDRRPAVHASEGLRPLLASPVAAHHDPGARTRGRRAALDRVGEILEHASHDFLDTARYLVLGITAASLLRVIVPTEALVSLAASPAAAAGVGLLLAYLLSLCSAADAFVARSLLASLPFSATLAFLLLGPMIDLKNTILLSRFIRAKQLVALVTMVFAVDFTASVVAWRFLGGGG